MPGEEIKAEARIAEKSENGFRVPASVQKMISRVRDTFQINVPMDKLFEVGTISDMSRVLAEHEQRPGMVDKIARIHKRLAEMSDAEASEMLNEKKNVRGESHHESV